MRGSGDDSGLRDRIDGLWSRHSAGDLDAASVGEDQLGVLDRFLDGLESGEFSAARRVGDAGDDPDRSGAEPGGSNPASRWEANEWVKRGILLNFALRETTSREHGGVVYRDVLGVRSGPLSEGTRNTPDGTVVRRGAHVGRDAILMSPSFVNLGASIGAGSLVDSCVTVGSCAQIGADVKLGANTLVGGVLEPVEDSPVVLEDGVSLGAGCRVTSGFVVGENAVVGENTLLSPRIPVYDLVEERVRYGHLPPGRRAFARFVESGIGDHDLFDGGAYKPAVVATDLEGTTLEAVEREEVLRS
jgi:2,3,4,5-tetrahydropyridine-2-carboxylate N-succinyltransferase